MFELILFRTYHRTYSDFTPESMGTLIFEASVGIRLSTTLGSVHECCRKSAIPYSEPFNPKAMTDDRRLNRAERPTSVLVVL